MCMDGHGPCLVYMGIPPLFGCMVYGCLQCVWFSSVMGSVGVSGSLEILTVHFFGPDLSHGIDRCSTLSLRWDCLVRVRY
ncbi:hypothetical protein BJX61DRAFT_507203 [Aspergillus egyptiacus]|nr:hypothetical protein BJX61DRAFT_507203 [Aspergillus egyptiacus]